LSRRQSSQPFVITITKRPRDTNATNNHGHAPLISVSISVQSLYEQRQEVAFLLLPSHYRASEGHTGRQAGALSTAHALYHLSTPSQRSPTVIPPNSPPCNTHPRLGSVRSSPLQRLFHLDTSSRYGDSVSSVRIRRRQGLWQLQAPAELPDQVCAGESRQVEEREDGADGGGGRPSRWVWSGNQSCC
jgi:hypothetical protein